MAPPSKAPHANFPSPLPKDIKAARLRVGLSHAQAAALVYRTARNFQQFEAGERAMDPAIWELFRIKIIMNNVLMWAKQNDR